MKKLLFISFLMLTGIAAWAQTLSGKITLEGSNASPIATIRIPGLGIGTTAKLDGTYEITDLKAGRYSVEYSYIGFKTIKDEITIGADEHVRHDVVMKEAPIMLDAVFITPDGSDPARYILDKALKNAESKYKKVGDFKGQTSTVLSFSEFDVISNFMPNSMRRLILFTAGIFGYKNVIKLILNHPDLDVTTTNTFSCTKGKYKWGKETLKKCNTTLNDKEKEALNKMAVHENLYNAVYQDNLFRDKKAKIRLKGSYQDGNDFIYILEARKNNDKDLLYVIDDKWDVIRYTSTYSGLGTLKIELRKSLGSLYMPISANMTITLMKKTAKELKELMEKEDNNLSDKEKEKMEKKSNKIAKEISKDKERSERTKAIEDRIKKHGIDLSINYGTSIKYLR